MKFEFNATELLIGIVAWIVGLAGAVFYCGQMKQRFDALAKASDGLPERVLRMETKLDFLLADARTRAAYEAVARGGATLNSPLHFADATVLPRLDPIKHELTRWWDERGKHVDFDSAIMELDVKFGRALVPLVCAPLSLHHRSCLYMALAVAKQTATLEVPGIEQNVEVDKSAVKAVV
jgi:hypothetical protein